MSHLFFLGGGGGDLPCCTVLYYTILYYNTILLATTKGSPFCLVRSSFPFDCASVFNRWLNDAVTDRSRLFHPLSLPQKRDIFSSSKRDSEYSQYSF